MYEQTRVEEPSACRQRTKQCSPPSRRSTHFFFLPARHSGHMKRENRWVELRGTQSLQTREHCLSVAGSLAR